MQKVAWYVSKIGLEKHNAMIGTLQSMGKEMPLSQIRYNPGFEQTDFQS